MGSILSLFACLSWVPLKYILLWTLGYIFMMHVESKEDLATRAKPQSWICERIIMKHRHPINGSICDQWQLVQASIILVMSMIKALEILNVIPVWAFYDVLNSVLPIVCWTTRNKSFPTYFVASLHHVMPVLVQVFWKLEF